MRKIHSLFIFILIATVAAAQDRYDSVTISRSLIEHNWFRGKWKDTLEAGKYKEYISQELTIWQKPAKISKVLPHVFALTNSIRMNGTDDVAKCFFPRHSINYYRGGKIARFLLICFECDGVRFSDDPPELFIKNIKTREKQMEDLKLLMKELL